VRIDIKVKEYESSCFKFGNNTVRLNRVIHCKIAGVSHFMSTDVVAGEIPSLLRKSSRKKQLILESQWICCLLSQDIIVSP